MKITDKIVDHVSRDDDICLILYLKWFMAMVLNHNSAFKECILRLGALWKFERFGV